MRLLRIAYLRFSDVGRFVRNRLGAARWQQGTMTNSLRFLKWRGMALTSAHSTQTAVADCLVARSKAGNSGDGTGDGGSGPFLYI